MNNRELKVYLKNVEKSLEVGNRAPLMLLLDGIVQWIEEQEQGKRELVNALARANDVTLRDGPALGRAIGPDGVMG